MTSKKQPKLSDDEQLDRVTLLLVTLLDRSAVETACRDELGLTPAKAAELIDLAAVRVTAAAAFDRDHQLGRAISRLNDLYQRSLVVQDVKTALAAQREINQLLRLKEPRGAGAEPPAEPPAEPEARQPMSPLEALRIIG